MNIIFMSQNGEVIENNYLSDHIKIKINFECNLFFIPKENMKIEYINFNNENISLNGKNQISLVNGDLILETGILKTVFLIAKISVSNVGFYSSTTLESFKNLLGLNPMNEYYRHSIQSLGSKKMNLMLNESDNFYFKNYKQCLNHQIYEDIKNPKMEFLVLDLLEEFRRTYLYKDSVFCDMAYLDSINEFNKDESKIIDDNDAILFYERGASTLVYNCIINKVCPIIMTSVYGSLYLDQNYSIKQIQSNMNISKKTMIKIKYMLELGINYSEPENIILESLNNEKLTNNSFNMNYYIEVLKDITSTKKVEFVNNKIKYYKSNNCIIFIDEKEFTIKNSNGNVVIPNTFFNNMYCLEPGQYTYIKKNTKIKFSLTN